MLISLVLADDHAVLLDGLESLLRQHDDLTIVGRCTGGAQAIDAVRRLQPDILVLDISMPEVDGLQVVRTLIREEVSTRVVVLTAALDDLQIAEVVRLGVAAVVLKESASSTLVEALRAVAAGGRWLDARIMTGHDGAFAGNRRAQEALAALSPREIEIARAVVRGMRNRQIAELFGITEGTVKLHLHHIYDKLGLDGRVALTLYARDAFPPAPPTPVSRR